MYVKTIIILCVIIIGFIVYLFFRGRSNRSRVQPDRDSINNITTGINDSKESIDRIGTGLEKLNVNTESAIKRTEDIKQNNINAGTGINNALGILRKAKDRNNT